MQHPRELQQTLQDLEPRHEYLVAIDSDGCVFDTMELKHKECFCPAFIRFFELQQVARYARQTWEFVNLYSRTRGVNRYIGLRETMKLLAGREQVQIRKVQLPDMKPLEQWLEQESQPSLHTLESYAKKAGNPMIERILRWSQHVNGEIEKMVQGVGPFPHVREVLAKITARADVIVVSQTPVKDLQREWIENKLDHHVRIIAGQEYGAKKKVLDLITAGKYPRENILMMGDAPGDLQAASSNNILFYPINPGHEEQSWQEFTEKGLDHFFDHSFNQQYQQHLISAFNALLPEKPSWE